MRIIFDQHIHTSLGQEEHRHRHRQTSSNSLLSLDLTLLHTHRSYPLFLSFSSCRFLFQAVSFYISFHSSLYFLNVSTAHGCYYKRSFLPFYYLSLQGHHHLPSSSPSSRRPSFTSLLQLFTSLPNLIRIQIPHTLSKRYSTLYSTLFSSFLICLLPSTFPFPLSLFKWRNLGLLWTNSKRMNVLLLFN